MSKNTRNPHRRTWNKTSRSGRQAAKYSAIFEDLNQDAEAKDTYDLDQELEYQEDLADIGGNVSKREKHGNYTGRIRLRAIRRPQRGPAAVLSSPDFLAKATRKIKPTRTLAPSHQRYLEDILASVKPGERSRVRKLLYSILRPDEKRQVAQGVKLSKMRVGPNPRRLQVAVAAARKVAQKLPPVLVPPAELAKLREIKRVLYAPLKDTTRAQARKRETLNSRGKRSHEREARAGVAPPAPLSHVVPPRSLRTAMGLDNPLYNPVGLLKELADKGWPRTTYVVHPVPGRPAHSPLFAAQAFYNGRQVSTASAGTKKEAESLAANVLIGTHPHFPMQLLVAILKRQEDLKSGRLRGQAHPSLLKNLHLSVPQLNGANGEVTGSDDLAARGGKGPRGKGMAAQLKAVAKKEALDVATIGLVAARNQAISRLPKPLRAPAARALNGLGKTLRRRIVGSGDYATSDGIAHNPILANTISPGMSFGDHMATRYRHREFICDVRTGPVAGGWNCTAYPIQPSSPLTFPYLSSLALANEQYHIVGLIFEFITSSSNYSAQGSLGTGVMAYSSNPLALPFTTKNAMENSNECVSFRFDKSAAYGIECEKGQNTQMVYYVKNNATGSAPLVETATDMGVFFFGTAPGTNYATNSVIGELHVTYDIEFIKPRLSPSRFGFAHHYRSNVTDATPMGTITYLEPVTYGAGNGSTTSGTTFTIPYTSQGDIWDVTMYWTSVNELNYPTVSPLCTYTGWTPQAVYPGVIGGPNQTTSSQTFGQNEGVPPPTPAQCTRMTFSVTLLVTSANSASSSITVASGNFDAGGGSRFEIVAVCIGNSLPRV